MGEDLVLYKDLSDVQADRHYPHRRADLAYGSSSDRHSPTITAGSWTRRPLHRQPMATPSAALARQNAAPQTYP
jgi:hypothetical protein